MFNCNIKVTVQQVYNNNIRENYNKYSVIQKDGLNFVHLYSLNYTWYVNDLHNI